MSKDNKDFFREKQRWSEVKDELLGCYLKPYIQKIIYTNRPIVYVDCFAGKGKFDDGKLGSPLIALSVIDKCLKCSKADHFKKVETTFIDVNYAGDLKHNLKKYDSAKIISGTYEETIENLLQEKQNSNIFLYIDPYGIRSLNANLFHEFKNQRYNFHSIELLINLNSFGFIREGCRVLGVPFSEDYLLEDLVEYESLKLDKNEKSVKILDKIAGGDYWQEIIRAKNRNEITVLEAEKKFVDEYCNQLRKSYNYVLNMPIRIKKNKIPKYRMIHVTDHYDGCILMATNICNRWEVMKDIQENGQMSLFAEDCNNEIIDERVIECKVTNHAKNYNKFERLNKIIAEFFIAQGPICTEGNIKKVLKKLETKNSIEVKRSQAITKEGKPCKSFQDGSKNKIEIRWKNENDTKKIDALQNRSRVW